MSWPSVYPNNAKLCGTLPIPMDEGVFALTDIYVSMHVKKPSI